MDVLVALPDQYRKLVSEGLVEALFSVIEASTIEVARDLIQHQKLLAVILASSWVFNESSDIDLISLTTRKIPTVTLIEKETLRKYGQHKVFDKVYNQGELQEFCFMPFSIKELLSRMQNVISKAK